MLEEKLVTLGILFLFAVIGGVLAYRFKQPVVLGLLVVGTIIGPHALGLVKDLEMINLMIEFGAILFLFVIGMEFSLKQLLAIGPKALVVGLLKVGIMFFFGYLASLLLGLGVTAAAFVGIIISFSSTMIAMNVLKQRGLAKRPEVPLLLAILILEDLMGVVSLTFFASMRPSASAGLAHALFKLVISLAILITVYAVMARVAEYIMSWMTKNAGEEAVPFISLGLCAGFAGLAFILGLSPSVGAFLAGSVVSTLSQAKLYEHAIKPHSFMFTSLFFLAVGTLIDFSAIGKYLSIILVLLAVMLGGMFVSVGVITKLFASYSPKSAFFSSVAMIPLGIFSLLVAKEAVNFNLGIDLVTIASVLIFTLAIILSVSIKHADALYELFFAARAAKKGAVAKFSHYITSVFDELSNEDAYTRRLKSKSLALGLEVFALLIGILAVINVPSFLPSLAHWLLPIIMIAAVLGLLVLALFVRKQALTTGNALVKVMVRLQGGTGLQRTRRIVRHTAYLLLFGILGLYSPMLLFLAGLPWYYIGVSVLLVGLAVYHFGRAARLLDGFTTEYKHSVRSYKKLDVAYFRNASD